MADEVTQFVVAGVKLDESRDKIGWLLIPYPVDYQTADIEMFTDWPDVAANLANIGVALKEWIGLVGYYVMDRTDELFPGPDN